MRRRWFFGISLSDTGRWSIAAIFVVVAALVTPMPMALHIVLAVAAWLIAVAWIAICIGWDFFRWHWPFFPIEIQEQVSRGIALLRDLRAAGEETCWQWRNETRARIETRWGSRSSQLKAFDDAQAVRVTLPQAQHLEVRMHQQLEALQGLDPGRPLFRAAKVGLTPK